jgi:hypothetical protein
MVVIGVLAALVGIAVIVTGVIIRQPPVGPLVGVAGFVLLVAGAVFAMAPPRRGAQARPSASSSTPGAARPSAARPARSGSMMDRLNDRWERRQDGDRS